MIKNYSYANTTRLATLQIHELAHLLLFCISHLAPAYIHWTKVRCLTWITTAKNITIQFQCLVDVIDYDLNTKSSKKNFAKKNKFFYLPVNSHIDANFKFNSPKITSDILPVPTNFMKQTEWFHRFFLILYHTFCLFHGKSKKFSVAVTSAI